MAVSEIRFDDGASYERYMGVWSRLVGETFLSWLAPSPGLRWIDIGCGNGAFTEQIVERCAPAEVQGVDPSEAQLVFARSRPAARLAEFRQGDAMALPFPERQLRGGRHGAGHFLRSRSGQGRRRDGAGGSPGRNGRDLCMGHPGWRISVWNRSRPKCVAWASRPMLPPSVGASRMDALRTLWTGAGFTAVETREISVQRTFANFDDFWTIILLSPSLRPMIAAMSSEDIAGLEARVQARLLPDAAGRITYAARANAIKGRVVSACGRGKRRVNKCLPAPAAGPILRRTDLPYRAGKR